MALVLGSYLSQHRSDRCGVIPYVIVNGEIQFLFAIDSKTKDLTDMGGGVKKDESTLMAGIREFREESGGLFEEYYDANVICRYVALYSKNISILFVPLQQRWFYSDLFQEFKIVIKNREVCGTKWISERILRDYMRGNIRLTSTIYKKVHKFLACAKPETLYPALKLCFNV